MSHKYTKNHQFQRFDKDIRESTATTATATATTATATATATHRHADPQHRPAAHFAQNRRVRLNAPASGRKGNPATATATATACLSQKQFIIIKKHM
jgi:hypothetical protein